MQLEELMRNGANVTLAVSVNDLHEWSKGLIAEAKREFEGIIITEKTETYLTAKQTAEKLGVDLSTLWRWERDRYLIPVRTGRKRKYKVSDINSMLNH